MGIVGEHFFETPYHSTIVGLLNSTIVRRIEPGEYVTTRVGLSGQLDEEGRKHVLKFLFVDIPKVKIEIGN